MSSDIPLASGEDAFPTHVFDAFGVPPQLFEERLGGSVMVLEKQPAFGPITVMTAGASRLPTGSGERVELAVECVDGQQGAALVALRIVCDDMAMNHRVPPVGAPWRNSEPFLNGTGISAIVATGSRWGAELDDVRTSGGTVVGHVRTLRLITDAEAAFVAERGWDALVEQAGSIDALLDVTREGTVAAEAGAAADQDVFHRRPVFQTLLHQQHPPRWITYRNGAFESVTGLESDEYMSDSTNLEVVSVESYLARFPWVRSFLEAAQPGQTALFTDATGGYVLEED